MLKIIRAKATAQRFRLFIMAAVLATSGLVGLITQKDTAYAAAGDTWQARAAAEQNSWLGVAYGNGTFVAVAGNGTHRVMTSTDGIHWTARDAALQSYWYAVTYGDGLFVAVSNNGHVMSSPDGINWTQRTAPVAGLNWYTVTYGNGMFVAGAANSGPKQVMTSPDGITWTARSTPSNYGPTSIVWGNGQFVATASASSGLIGDVLTSPDGITWTDHTTSQDGSWRSITYGNNRYVATALSGTKSIMTSSDGVNWATASYTGDNWIAVTYGNGTFVAVSIGGGSSLLTSIDGVNWAVHSAGTNALQAVTYANGLFVAVGGGVKGVTTSGELATYGADTVAMHGYIRDTYDNHPIPYASVSLSCGEGVGDVLQADATGAYTMTMGQLYDAIDNNCAYAMGIGMYASADTYPQGDEEWSGNRYGDQDWQGWIVDHFNGQSFDFHLVGDGSQNSGGGVMIDGNTADLTTATGNKTVTLTVDDSCTLSDVSTIDTASTPVKDAAYTYNTGFIKFTATGCDDNIAHVQLLYHGVSPDNLVVRKYNPNKSSYFTITDATMTKVGNDTLVSYTITDGGDLDIDGVANNSITDPVGLGSLAVGVPNTGLGGAR